MSKTKYPKIAQFKTVEKFAERLLELGLSLPCDPAILSAENGSPLAKPLQIGRLEIGNRWCIHPMEGWDANRDGTPTAHTIRRWQRFGQSGAKLIWGGEAAAVRPDGRANPNQTLATSSNEDGLRKLLFALEEAHQQACGSTKDLLVGLQLTHSGRFCKPHDHQRWESRIAYHHPILDPKFGISPNDISRLFTDGELDDLIDAYLAAAKLAERVGFRFVDVKACHGYLLHEFLSARTRPGRFGGDLYGRTLLLRTIIERIREGCPNLEVGVRLSLFDTVPFQPGDSAGVPAQWETPYLYGFGCSQSNPLEMDLTEPLEVIRMLSDLGVSMVNLSAGSPYYNPHIQRPAIFPPSDGYQPPEDPLVGVVRQINAVAEIKRLIPQLPIVGSGYTYLQEFLPLVAQSVVREQMVDVVGLGRMVLSHPTLPLDTLAGRQPTRKLVCRTFSDCTTAPRNGIISGCYPLDEYYKALPERQELLQAKELSEGTEQAE
ncbi:MAG: NADH:flavin oxidoreductase [Planctomycetales bacterium]|nr:NADH:flavin oxidoreductase [Planctomycetales bacterium]